MLYQYLQIQLIFPDGLIVGSANVASSEIQNTFQNSQQAIAVWGDDPYTPEIDGLIQGQELYFQLVDGLILYDLTVYFANPNTYLSGSILGTTSVSYEINILGGCTRLGCTSEWSVNYDELATDDNGSCIKYGCMSEWADNYDNLATQDDGTCFRLGCTDIIYCNYDHLATEDNESCEGIPGCMEPIYVQYSETAGCSNPDLCLTTWEETYYFALDSAAVAFSADEEADEALLAIYIENLLAYTIDSAAMAIPMKKLMT